MTAPTQNPRTARPQRAEALVAAHDARGEGRPAGRRVGRRRRGRWRRRPAPGRDDRRRAAVGRAHPARARPADPPVRHRAGRPRRWARGRWPRRRREIVAASRFGIPAQVHEECLAGLRRLARHRLPGRRWAGAPRSTPTWSRRWPTQIGRSMRAVGVHQGLAPVLDVTRDYRWGRTEETIGEDPYLVGTVGAAYVRGPGGRRDRRHAQALRRATRPRAAAATSRRSRSGRASSPT